MEVKSNGVPAVCQQKGLWKNFVTRIIKEKTHLEK